MLENPKLLATMAFYAYLTMRAGPQYFGEPIGYVAGAAGSYALWTTVGRSFAYN